MVSNCAMGSDLMHLLRTCSPRNRTSCETGLQAHSLPRWELLANPAGFSPSISKDTALLAGQIINGSFPSFSSSAIVLVTLCSQVPSIHPYAKQQTPLKHHSLGTIVYYTPSWQRRVFSFCRGHRGRLHP